MNAQYPIDSLKHNLIDLLLITGVCLGLLSYVIGTYPFGAHILSLDYIFDLVGLIALFSIYFLRKRISLQVKTLVIIMALYGICISDLIINGMYSRNMLLLPIIPFLAMIVFDIWRTLLVSLSIVVPYSIIGFFYLDNRIATIARNPNAEAINWADTLLLLSVLAVLFSLFVHRFDTSIKTFVSNLEESNKALKQRDKLLAENLEEKKVLLQEIHHRVKNNLAVVSGLLMLQSKNIENEEMEYILEKSVNRILSISKVHELLYESKDFTKIPFEEYVTELSKTVLNTMNSEDKEVNFTSNIQVENISINHGVPLGIIFNELITNSLKYGFNGSTNNVISIDVFEDGDHIFVTYKDNGIGIADFEAAACNSLGLTLITSLLDQIDATYEFVTDNGFDLSFRFQNYVN